MARVGAAVWLDLGDQDGRAVRITATGWSVEKDAPVMFKRTELTGTLPEPAAGGSIAELWEWLNVEPEDRPLVVAYLLAALFPSIPHPVLGIFGEQGTGKSTAAKALSRVIDPSPVPVRKPPKDPESWVTAAAGSWVVAVDNLSDVSPWLSDSICRAVTGDGDVRRRLYTDGELSVFAFRRVVVLNGIDLGAIRGDLADRILPIDLHVIPEGDRREEHELWPLWDKAHPRLLGALLDLAAGLLARLDSVRLVSKPRMADFARILKATDELLGTDGYARYTAKQKAMAKETLTDDEFVIAMTNAISDTFTGTAAELLETVTPTGEKWKAPKGWPATGRAVTQRLRRQAPVLRKAGWSVTDDGGANKQKALRWTIEPPAGVGNSQEMGSGGHPPHPPHPSNGDLGGSAGVAGADSYLPRETSQPPPALSSTGQDHDANDGGSQELSGPTCLDCGRRTPHLAPATRLCANCT